MQLSYCRLFKTLCALSNLASIVIAENDQSDSVVLFGNLLSAAAELKGNEADNIHRSRLALVMPVLSNHSDVISQRWRIVQRRKMTAKFLDCRQSASSSNNPAEMITTHICSKQGSRLPQQVASAKNRRYI